MLAGGNRQPNCGNLPKVIFGAPQQNPAPKAR
jgi:hypothetical protein